MMVKWINLDIKGDQRGSLVAIEESIDIPFLIKRVYYIFGTRQGVKRGCHAHKELQQVAICVRGSCRMLLEDSSSYSEVELNSPDRGLHIDRLVWHEMYDFSEDCVLMVLADNHYCERDYIRDYEVFKQTAKVPDVATALGLQRLIPKT